MTDASTDRTGASAYTVLVVEPDARVRALVLSQLATTGCALLEAPDGETAMALLRKHDVRVVLTELYLKTGESHCLIQAIRSEKSLRKTRALAHTQFNSSNDRDWAIKVGADAFLIRPVRAARLRDVVSRLANQPRGRPSASGGESRVTPIARRDSLDVALNEKERGADAEIATIIFGKAWWTKLTPEQQKDYRKRAKKAGVSLRSDSVLRSHFVEVRGRSRTEQGLSTERPESPYRR